MALCCGNCFSDRKISEYILINGNFIDRCSYCESENINAIDPSQLFEFIEKIDSSFLSNSEGVSLYYLLSDKFHLFNNKIHDSKLLFMRIIVGSEYLEKKKYTIDDSQDTFQDWKLFMEEIKSENRFFPQTKLYKDIFSHAITSSASDSSAFFSLVETLKIRYQAGQLYYRGRTSTNKLSIESMGMPPSDVVSGGRANPVGIPYLYLADNIKTCVAEIRPSNGSKINIAKFRLIKEVNLLDITEPRRKASFMVLEEQELRLSLKYIDLLEVFSDELSFPILPHNSHLDYIPTQFLCEYFKTVCKYDGIIFNSSFGHGKNIVLFNEHCVVGDKNINYLQVSKISHEFKDV